MILAALLATGPKKDGRQLDKATEYDLLPVCVENILVNNLKFHCVVDDIKRPTAIACDGESFKVMLKKGSSTDNCVTIHMVFPKEAR